MNEIKQKENIIIEDMIYEVRGVQVMFDYDLAILYQCTNGTKDIKRGQNIKYLPHAFTEQGIAMLASVLHNEIAEEISVRIMRSFVKMRKYFKKFYTK